MSDFVLNSLPNLVIASYSSSRLGQYALNYGNRFMLIMDPVLRAVGLAEKITSSLSDRNVDYFVFDSLSETADAKTVNSALELARSSHVQGIICFGGGKAFSVARCTASLFFEADGVYEFLDGKKIEKKPLPLICLNSTCRDPFIFTDFVPIVDSRTNQTKLIKVQPELCKALLFDPILSVTFTENQKDTMTLESICLALEGFLSQKSSFFTEMTAEKSMEQLKNVINTNEVLSSVPAEEFLVQGGVLASLCAGSSGIGVASLLALTINSRYKVGHALVSAILLPYILEEYAKFKLEQTASIGRILFPSEKNSSSETAVKIFAESIREFLAKKNLPTRLKELSVTIEQLSLAVEDATKLDFMNGLPKSMTAEELFEIVKNAW